MRRCGVVDMDLVLSRMCLSSKSRKMRGFYLLPLMVSLQCHFCRQLERAVLHELLAICVLCKVVRLSLCVNLSMQFAKDFGMS